MDYAYATRNLDYDPETGIFTFKKKAGDCRENKRWNTRYAGSVAGYKQCCKHTKKTYVRVNIEGKSFAMHRLAWFVATGSEPKGEIDHIDGDGTNNRLGNLRDVDRAGNRRNLKRYSSNSSGVAGVNKHHGKWAARISVNGKRVVLGSFDDIDDAIKARAEAEVKYGFHENHGKR